MGSDAYPHSTKDDRNAVTCLLMDSCDRWRRANGLVNEDYRYSDLEVLHCPLYDTSSEKVGLGEETVGTPTVASPKNRMKTLRYCYMEGQMGYKLVVPVDVNKLWGVNYEDG